MGKEIERKFLVCKEKWQPKDSGVEIRQGYLSSVKERVVRVRTKGEKGFLTVKGQNQGISRLEFEYEIPFADAEQLLLLCETPLVEKIRYREIQGDLVWEIDYFLGANAGLVVAEIELPAENTEFLQPDWIGKEVSGDVRYYNSNLIAHPYREWK